MLSPIVFVMGQGYYCGGRGGKGGGLVLVGSSIIILSIVHSQEAPDDCVGAFVCMRLTIVVVGQKYCLVAVVGHFFSFQR